MGEELMKLAISFKPAEDCFIAAGVAVGTRKLAVTLSGVGWVAPPTSRGRSGQGVPHELVASTMVNEAKETRVDVQTTAELRCTTMARRCWAKTAWPPNLVWATCGVIFRE